MLPSSLTLTRLAPLGNTFAPRMGAFAAAHSTLPCTLFTSLPKRPCVSNSPTVILGPGCECSKRTLPRVTVPKRYCLGGEVGELLMHPPPRPQTGLFDLGNGRAYVARDPLAFLPRLHDGFLCFRRGRALKLVPCGFPRYA